MPEEDKQTRHRATKWIVTVPDQKKPDIVYAYMWEVLPNGILQFRDSEIKDNDEKPSIIACYKEWIAFIDEKRFNKKEEARFNQ